MGSQIKYKVFSPIFGMCCVLILFTACVKKESSPGSPTVPTVSPTEAGGGGIDGSGGNATGSSLEQIGTAYDRVTKSLNLKIQQSWFHLTPGFFWVEFQYGEGTYDFLNRFLGAKAEDKKLSYKLLESLQEKNILFLPSNEPCQSLEGNTDGSAKGTLEKGQICINLSGFKKIPLNVLEQQIFGLLVHELSHLSGFTEQEAQKLQKLIIEKPSLYAVGQDPSAPTVIPFCNGEIIEGIAKKMEKSSYWKSRQEEIMTLLSGKKKRDCENVLPSTGNTVESKLSIFADDIEYLQGTPKFVKSTGGSLKPIEGQGPFQWIGYNWVQELTVVTTYFVQADEARFNRPIEALIGTDAQCNPKVLVANILANIPDALEARCGDSDINTPEKVRARVSKEKEILEGDPDKDSP